MSEIYPVRILWPHDANWANAETSLDPEVLKRVNENCDKIDGAIHISGRGIATHTIIVPHGDIDQLYDKTAFDPERFIRFGQKYYGDRLPPDYEQRFHALFTNPKLASEETIRIGESEKIIGPAGQSYSFLRVSPLTLYNMVDGFEGRERHFIHELYTGKMLDHVRAVFGDTDEYIVPFDIYDEEERNYMYVGNGLAEAGQAFPAHLDTEGTVSVLLFVSGNCDGGEFVISFERTDAESEKIELWNSFSYRVESESGWGLTFVADELMHGSLTLAPDSPPRWAVAFSFKDKRDYRNNRDPEFKKHRKSQPEVSGRGWPSRPALA